MLFDTNAKQYNPDGRGLRWCKLRWFVEGPWLMTYGSHGWQGLRAATYAEREFFGTQPGLTVAEAEMNARLR